ncbi:MAG: molecular chaperone DnaK, partial [Thermodesulfobacteriota bacterium]
DKSFKEFEDKLSDDDKKELQEALEQGRNAIKGEDTQAIEQATKKITQASHKLAELMYKQQESSGAPTEEPQGDAPENAEANDDTAEESDQDNNDDVIDAEFTEK